MTDPEDFDETYKKGFDPDLWRKIFLYTLPYKRLLVGLAVAGVGAGVIEVAFPLVTRAIVDDVATGVELNLLRYGLIYGSLTLAFSCFVCGFVWVGGALRTHVAHDIRSAGFDKLQDLSFSFYDHRSVGWLMARMTSDCERLSMVLAWGVLDMFWGLTQMTGIALVLLALDARLALISLSVVPVLALVSVFFQMRILKASRRVRKTNSILTGAFNEAIMGVRTTKALVREAENLQEFRQLSRRMNEASVTNALHSATYFPLVLTLGSLATGLALAVGGVQVGPAMSLGTLVAFLVYTTQFFQPVHELAYWFAELQMAQASGERILGLIEEVPQVRDTPEVLENLRRFSGRTLSEDQAPDGHRQGIGELEFSKVSFTYEAGEEVLKDVDLRVKAGTTVALVGPTGGGKTTLASLLCRFYEPTKGEILLDGIDYRRRSLHWLQSNLGVVLQTPHLFSGTIAENISYGRLDATRDEVVEAAQQVHAHDFVSSLENGYDTNVGEGGTRLSVGQKQLVSFARALLARPQILVMDEATSSVDTETEKRIQKGLESVLAGRTSFVIAHRLSTIRAADRILVVEAGRIVEDDSHRALLAQKGRYYRLYRQQSFRTSL